MTGEQKTRIQKMRQDGAKYGEIAREVGLSINTVKSFCRRYGISSAGVEKDVKPAAVQVKEEKEVARKIEKEPEGEKAFCKCCGSPIIRIPGRKEKLFCDDTCRMKWWNSHSDMVDRRSVYSYTCAYCGKSFSAYANRKRKYCCHECYIADRFGG